MRLSRRDFGLGVIATALLPTAVLARQAGKLDADLTAFLDRAFEEELAMDPEQLSQLGRKQQYDRLTDRSEAAQKKRLDWRRANVKAMKRRFDPAKLGEDARTSYDMWLLELDRAEDYWRWRDHNYTFARGGAHTGLPNFMINMHPVDTSSDAEAYIARVAAIGGVLDVQLDQARRAAAKGVRMPRFSYDQANLDVRRVTTGAPFDAGPDSALFADAKAKFAALQTRGVIGAAQAAQLTKAVADAMTGSMKPAYDRLAAWLTTDREQSAADPRGAGALPDGAAYYNAMLRLQTTTDMTADQIHELGLAEVKRIRAEMETLKARIGFAGPLEDFFAYLKTDDRFYVTPDDAGRARYLKLADGYLAAMKARLPEQFGRLPRSPLVVKRVEPYREEPGGAAHYNSGSVDGSRPGVFYVHLSDVRATPLYEIEGTSYHEGWPGHHMQISIAQELTGLPVFRTQYGYGAYAEGWGLYVERLAKEMDFYQDPYSDFGRLGREIWRAIRLVVDTGIHAKGWSEEQATEFYTANSPQPAAKIKSEIRRYFVSPGQATSYKVGMVKILALRDEARTAMGAKYDQRAFHDLVISGGSLPLGVLETRVRRWVAKG
ncbi:DUF885 domain-containing protein [Caulobacter sp. NIBR1757]|uniref:DUF885 domain-containing protein n=1 Tax=Caulobacter sp. NIBR1757 TaxID=3016000 RepID=UPI0022F0E34F|nr:DUF885 domain-containing protein [Caulobacter sp. NIBR1757]WGM39122.1 hypothetical protein AMEJIAPC_02036 [Caulobacter sp. NIBR1757]